MPDATILWIDKTDFPLLGKQILSLQSHGLTIKECPAGYLSYDKIVHALAEFPSCYIATADDDVYYWRTWLSELAKEVTPGVAETICHRAHRILLDERGMPVGYNAWEINTSDTGASELTFPTGVGGVLYPPGILHSQVLDADLFMTLCPKADDVWLYWMARLNGAKSRKIGPVRSFRPWIGSQKVSLFSTNSIGDAGNDQQIAAMVRAYGWPS